MKNEETRKQTIEYLDRIKEDYVSNVGNIPSVEPEYFAIVEAIELLSQDPCDDAISRQAVLNILDDMVIEYIKENDFDKAQGVAWVKVQQLSSVSTEKTGRWIDTGSGQECSECGEIQYGYDSFRKYCPNCGARMVEPQESEDKE